MLIGQRIGPFEIIEEIGSGAMGTVYKARYHQPDRPTILVALKVISFGLLGNEGAMARFDREATILKQLRHPHIVRLFATGHHKQTPFIAMEYVAGESLDKKLALMGKLGWEEVVHVGKQLSSALQHAHEKGIIHRDLKPSNLIVTREGVLKLTDFGIAKDTDVTALTGANSTIGTAAYMSPEQCRGDRNLTTKSDLYSFGIVLYELLTGRKPFSAETTVEMFLKHVNETPIRPRKLVPDVPVWLDNLVMFLLEKDKDHRPLDAATVARMLEDVEEKVSTQQSVGAELANARRMDRPIGDGPADESDREMARYLRAPGKKRKKKRGDPVYHKTWFKALVISVPLLALLAFGAYMVWEAVKPETLEQAFARIEDAPGPDARLAAAEKFLRQHGDAADPRVEQARAVYREMKARETEVTITKRFHTKFKGNYDGYDKAAYDTAIQAMDAERSGDLKVAADLWGAVRDSQAALDPDRLLDKTAATHASLGWVGEKRVRALREGLPRRMAEVTAGIEDDRRYESPRTYEPTDPAGLAVLAIRLEAFGDEPKARAKWELLRGMTEKEVDYYLWYVMATQHLLQLDSAKGTEKDLRERRLKNLEDRFRQLRQQADQVRDNPEARAEHRDVRNGFREIIALYDDETNPDIKSIVEQARQLLESLQKK